MSEITEAMFNDDLHWRVQLKGNIAGQQTLRAYHLEAGSATAVRKLSLLKWGSEFDTIPFVDHVERYRAWRLYERSAEGECGK